MKVKSIKNTAVNPYSLEESKGRNVMFGNGSNSVKYGADNLLPNYFIKLAREIWSHRAILNSKTRYTAGNGLTSEDQKTIDFLNTGVNNVDVSQAVKRGMFDEFASGYSVFDIASDKNFGFLQINHVDSAKARILKDGTGLVFMPDWAKPKKEDAIEVPFYPNFAPIPQDDGLVHSVILKRNYEPMFVNGVPSWFAGLKKAIISGLIDVSNKSELETGHALTGMLFIPNVTDPKDAELVEQKIEEIKGAEHHGDILVGYYETMGSGKDAAPQLVDFRKKIEGNYVALGGITSGDLVVVHEWFRSLSGFIDNTGFDVSRILNEYEVALASSIVPKQNEYLKILNPVLEAFGYKEITFINEAPFQMVKDDDLLAVWEVREKAGLDFDKERPEQQILMYNLKSK